CHAWGASPIYLLGKYYLGIQPVKAGYSEFAIAPNLGGLKWMEGTVPTPNGIIHLYMNEKTIKVKTVEGKGYLTFVSKSQPKTSKGIIEKLSRNNYRLLIEGQEEVVVSYK
ncbi:MAG: alpha-L-rhamnosidase C-terminal domain-containing protein, partial [Paludibacter sp.]